MQKTGLPQTEPNILDKSFENIRPEMAQSQNPSYFLRNRNFDQNQAGIEIKNSKNSYLQDNIVQENFLIKFDRIFCHKIFNKILKF